MLDKDFVQAVKNQFPREQRAAIMRERRILIESGHTPEEADAQLAEKYAVVLA